MLRFSLKLAISVGLVWMIIQQFDLGDLAERLETVSLGGALLVVFVLLTQCVVASLRWEWIIRVMGYSFPFPVALRAWLVGHFLGQGFPSTIGHDAFRVLSLCRGGIRAVVAFEIILLDRFTGVVALVLLAAGTLPIIVGMASERALLFPLILAITAATLVIVLLFSGLSLPGLQARFPKLAVVHRFRLNLRRLVETRRNIFWVFVPALIAHLLTVAAAYVIARDGGTQIGLLQCLALIPPAILMSLIPLSIAGWGIREGSVVAGALLLGIPPSDALFVSIMLGVGFLAVGAIGGCIWLVSGSGRAPILNARAPSSEASQDE